jgi:hypothetical protein
MKIAKYICKKFGDLCTKRNNLLHGTRSIGLNFDEEREIKVLKVAKWATSNEGLRAVKMPEIVADLNRLTDNCKHLANLSLDLAVSLPDIAGFEFDAVNKIWAI